VSRGDSLLDYFLRKVTGKNNSGDRLPGACLDLQARFPGKNNKVGTFVASTGGGIAGFFAHQRTASPRLNQPAELGKNKGMPLCRIELC